MKHMWKIGIAAVALIALAAATVGFVGAQTDEDGEGPIRNFVGRVAEKLGITEDELATAIDEVQLEIVDEKLADGTIDEEQAARLRERIESGEGSFGPLLAHKHRMHHFGFAIARHSLSGYADAAGITPAELLEAWQGEGTLGEVLAGLAVDTDAVTAQILADLEARLTEKSVDPERIEEAVTKTSEKLADALASEDPPARRWGHGGLRGDLPEDGPAVEETGSSTF